MKKLAKPKKEITLKQRAEETKKKLGDKNLAGFLYLGIYKTKKENEICVSRVNYISHSQLVYAIEAIKEDHPEAFLAAY